MTRLALFCATLLCLASAASVSAAEPPNHVPLPARTIVLQASLGSPNPLKDACGVALDPTGRVFVSNYYEHAIYVFALTEAETYALVDSIKLLEPPFDEFGKPFDGPCDLAFDASGNLYVNNWHRDVVKLTAAGSGFEPPVVVDSSHPTGITVDPASGNLLVDERVQVAEYAAPVSPGDPPVRTIGAGRIGDGYGVAVSGFVGTAGFPSTAGRVYVADAADETVKAFDPAISLTEPVEVIDGGGTAAGHFNDLADTDLAVDPRDGHLYVVDNLQPGFERPEAVVHEFSSLGYYRGPIPPTVGGGNSSGIIDAEPSSLAISDAGEVFLTSGNYFEDGTIHRNAEVRVFGPAAEVETRVLTVAKSGGGSGTVFSGDPLGLRCGSACEGEFNLARIVTLIAEPAPHSRFAGWSGCPDVRPSGACAVTMSADRSVVAEFEPIPQRGLTVAIGGSGRGSVASSPGGIACGGTCVADFDEDSLVTLRATAAAGSAFAGWGGCDSEPASGACAVTMSAARSVHAAFELVAVPPPIPAPPRPPRTLSVSAARIAGSGGSVSSDPGGIVCGGTCAAVYADGTTVSLVAHPDAGSAFLGWGGCDSVDGERCRVALGTDKTVVAAFGPGSPGPLRFRGLAVRGRTAILRVAVPAPGELAASSPRIVPVSALPVRVGVVGLRLRLNASGARALARARRHRLRVPVALSFAPFSGGAPVSVRREVVFGGRHGVRHGGSGRDAHGKKIKRGDRRGGDR